MNQVANQLNILGGNIRQGFAQQGKNREAMAILGLKEKQVDADIAHRKLQEPAMRFGGMKAQQEIDALNEPLSGWDLVPNNDMNSFEQGMWELSPEKAAERGEEPRPSLFNRTLQMMGASYDTDENSPTYKRVVKNGKVMSKGDFQQYAPRVAEMYFIEMDPRRVLRNQMEMYSLAGMSGSAAAEGKRRELEAQLNDPKVLLPMYEKKRDYLSQYSGPGISREMARLDRKISGYRDEISKAEERAYQGQLRDEDRKYQKGVRKEDREFRRQMQQDDWEHQDGVREDTQEHQLEAMNQQQDRIDGRQAAPAIKSYVIDPKHPGKATGYIDAEGTVKLFKEPIAIAGLSTPVKGTPLALPVLDPLGNKLETQEQLYEAYKQYGKKGNDESGRVYLPAMSDATLREAGFKFGKQPVQPAPQPGGADAGAAEVASPPAVPRPGGDTPGSHTMRLPMPEEAPPVPGAVRRGDGTWWVHQNGVWNAVRPKNQQARP